MRILGWWIVVRQNSLRCGNIGHQIPGKPENLLYNDPSEGIQWRIFRHFPEVSDINAHE